jgi:hypothetical protein
MSKKIPIDNKITFLEMLSEVVKVTRINNEKEYTDFFNKQPNKYVDINISITKPMYHIFDELIKDLRSKKNALLYLKTMEETEDTYELEKILKGE